MKKVLCKYSSSHRTPSSSVSLEGTWGGCHHHHHWTDLGWMSPPLSSGAASSSSSRVETGIGRHCNCHWAKGEPGVTVIVGGHWGQHRGRTTRLELEPLLGGCCRYRERWRWRDKNLILFEIVNHLNSKGKRNKLLASADVLAPMSCGRWSLWC